MRQRAWFAAIAAAATVGCVAVSLWGSLGNGFILAGDYSVPACDGCDAAGIPIGALAHGHLSTFFHTQPVMGSASLLLRAPFVALVGALKGSVILQYRIGALICLLAVVILLLPAVQVMLRSSQRPWAVLVVMVAVVAGPATLKAVLWGHPEEPLAAALAVAAVLAASRGRGVAAGALLGLAVATKQWGALAALPVLILAEGQRLKVLYGALAVGAALILPMFAADPSRFIDQNFHTASAQLGVTPTNVWWPFHGSGRDPTTGLVLNVVPGSLRELSHPLTVLLALVLSALYLRRSADRHPYDAFQLLALLFLIRCALDPLAISYHHAPFVIAIAVFEGLRRPGVPLVTLIATGALLLLGKMPSLGQPDLMNALYLAWTLPTIAYLIASCLGLRSAGERTPVGRLLATGAGGLPGGSEAAAGRRMSIVPPA